MKWKESWRNKDLTGYRRILKKGREGKREEDKYPQRNEKRSCTYKTKPKKKMPFL